MRILQVVHNFLPNATGGTEIYTYTLSKELSKSHDVYLFFKDTTIDKGFKKGEFDGLPFLAINPSKYLKKSTYFNLIKSRIYFTANNKQTNKLFKELIAEIKPDAIHFQHLIGLSMNLVNVAYRCKIPIAFTVHDYWFLCPKAHLIDNNNVLGTNGDRRKCIKCFCKQGLYKLKKVEIFQPNTYIKLPKNIAKIILNFVIKTYNNYYMFYFRPKMIHDIYKQVDVFITPSQKLKDKLTENGVEARKIFHIDSGINNKFLTNIQKTKSKKIRFSFIGSVSAHKGIEILIKTFNDIKDASLDIYGFVLEENKKRYLKLIKNKHIHFMSSFKYNEIGNIFSKTDILIVPSICMENSPLTIREAFMSKTPVIASDIGGLSEMIQDGETGLLFKVGDSRDLFKKIRYFIDNPIEIERMSKKIKKVKTIEENAKEMEAIYRELILKNSSK